MSMADSKGKKSSSWRPSTSNPYSNQNRVAAGTNSYYQVRKSLGEDNNLQIVNPKNQIVCKENNNEIDASSWFFKRRPRNYNWASNWSFIEGKPQNRTIDNQGKTLTNDDKNTPKVRNNWIPNETSKLIAKGITRPASGVNKKYFGGVKRSHLNNPIQKLTKNNIMNQIMDLSPQERWNNSFFKSIKQRKEYIQKVSVNESVISYVGWTKNKAEIGKFFFNYSKWGINARYLTS